MGQSAGEPRLVRVDAPGREEHVIPEGTTRIGRSRGSDICLRDSTVSRFHCYLLREGDVVRVFDGESKNPPRIDGEPADGQQLRSGHTLRVGKCEFVYEGPLPARPAARAAAATRPATTLPAAAARRRIARTAEPPVAAFILVLLLIPAAAWILVRGFPEIAGRRDAAPRPPEDAAARKLERTAEGLELRIAELLRAEAAHRNDADRAADDRRIEELAREIAELQAELARARAREAAVAAVAAPPPPPAPRGAEPEPAEFGAVLVDGVEREPPEARSRARTTAVVAARPPARRRSAREIGALVAALRARIDDYATHAITPESLEPELSDLAGTAGRDGADAMLGVHAHARGLERQVEASIDENRRRKETLLRAAEAQPAAAPEGSASKKGMPYGPSPGGEREANQRLLELSAKAMEIHTVHLEHLRPLVAAVLGALGTMEDPAALDHLRLRLVSENDGDLALAIIRALEAGRHRPAVPVLVKRLSGAQDPRLREAIRKALTAIAGADLGDRSGAWAEWWEREGK